MVLDVSSQEVNIVDVFHMFVSTKVLIACALVFKYTPTWGGPVGVAYM